MAKFIASCCSDRQWQNQSSRNANHPRLLSHTQKQKQQQQQQQQQKVDVGIQSSKQFTQLDEDYRIIFASN